MNGRSKFKLEALEPRLLLNGDGVVDLEMVDPCANSGQSVSAIEIQMETSSVQQELSYEVENILDGVEGITFEEDSKEVVEENQKIDDFAENTVESLGENPDVQEEISGATQLQSEEVEMDEKKGEIQSAQTTQYNASSIDLGTQNFEENNSTGDTVGELVETLNTANGPPTDGGISSNFLANQQNTGLDTQAGEEFYSCEFVRLTPKEAITDLIFVDRSVPAYDDLINDIVGRNQSFVSGDNNSSIFRSSQYEIVLIPSNQDGLQTIQNTLSRHENIQAVHIISHGQSGALLLGRDLVDSEVINEKAPSIKAWGNSLSPDADILLYGCDVGSGINGEAFVSILAVLTGADVATSNNPTGATEQGGDWVLEYNVGPIESKGFVAEYDYLLAATYTISGTAGNDTLEIRNNSTAGKMQFRLNTGAWQIFDLPINTLLIELGAGDDSVSLGAFDSSFSANLTINGQTGSDTVTLSGDLPLGGKNLSITSEAIGVNDGVTISAASNVTFNALATDESQVTALADLFSKVAGIAIEGDIAATGTISLTAGVVRNVDINTPSATDLGLTSSSNATVTISGAQLNAAALLVTARTAGTVSSKNTFDFLSGSTTNTFTENAVATISGASVINVTTLDVSAESATTYSAIGRNASNNLSGATRISLGGSTVNAGGITFSVDDKVSATADSPEVKFDLGLLLPVAIKTATARNQIDRDVEGVISASNINAVGNVVMNVRRDGQVYATAKASSLITTCPLPSTYTVTIGGTYASNTILGSVTSRVINNSVVTTTGSGGIQLEAKDTSAVDSRAEISQKTEPGFSIGDVAGGGLGVSIAFNAIGWKPGNFALATLDALIGTNMGTESPFEAAAYILDASITAGGNLSLNAAMETKLNATVSNTAETTASSLYGASGMSAGGVLASNMMSSKASAYIDYTADPGIVNVGGTLSVMATDSAGIYANSKIVSSSTTTSDGGMAILDEVIGSIISVDWESTDGQRTLNFGDWVRLSSDYANGGDPGAVYQYLGSLATVNLNLENYKNLDYWKIYAPTNIIPEGINLSDSDSVAVGGIVVRNDVRSDVEASIDNCVVNTRLAALNAILNATVEAKADSTAKSSGGSAYGSGTSLAINGVIATNLVLSDAVATITNSDVTTTSGDLTIDGINRSTIDATTQSVTTSGDTAAGITLAFNTIGWESQNVLFRAINALIGTDIGDEDPALVKATVVDSNLNIAGSLRLSADSTAKINAVVGNDATSSASALIGASGMAISGALVSNMVNSAAYASIDYTGARGTVGVTGTITITAKDDASISADSTMKAISSTTNDGGASILGGLVDAVSDEYAFTSNSGSRFIKNAECVRVASTHGSGGGGGSIYKYLGNNTALNLGTTNYSDTNAWKRQTKQSVMDSFSGLNVSDSDSMGAGGIVVRNDVRSDVQSYINNAAVTSGNLFLSADESATILALLTGITKSSGGSSFGEGDSLAVNAQIATNLVLSKANAYIKDSTVTAANVGVDSKNTSTIDVTIDASTKSGDTAVGVTLAFNTVGWEAQNILFAAIDALIGTNIGAPQPAETLSTLRNTSVNITGNLTLKADSTALINSTVTNAAVSEASALFGASGTGASAILSSNMVNSKAEATINFTTSGIVSVGGVLDMDATDNATIHADTIIVSSSTTTNDFGAGIARDVISGQIDVEFLSEDGSKEIEFGEKVRKGDQIFEYLGNKETVNLTTVDYADLDYWKEVSGTKIIPKGMNFDDSDSMAIGGLVVRNDVRSDVKTSINRGTITAGSASLNATLNVTIKAKADSTVTSSGGSAFGSGDSLAINATIATNLVLSDAVATITNSDVTTTSGNLTVDGVNSSTIDATTKNMTSSGDTAVGVTLAFNTIGWEAQNILFGAIDALIGTDIGNEDPALVNASIVNSDLHLAGSLNLSADSKATLNVLVCNDAKSAASALVDASGKAIGVVLASNMVSSAAQAFIDHTGSQGIVDVSGSITITAKDDASISADSTMKAISSTTNDGGASVLGGLVDAVSDEYAFTSNSGSRFIKNAECVRVASTHGYGGVGGSIYKYLGNNTALNLGTTNYSDTNAWKRQTKQSVVDSFSGLNVSDSDSVGAGGIVVRNDVRSDVQSYINNAAVTSGNLFLSADESATILALLTGITKSSGGSSFGEGTSLAVNAQIATNLVLSKANAYVKDSTVTAANVGVDSKNTSIIDATINASTKSGDTAVGVTLAFNTVGWEAQNILFAAIDALIGTNIGDPQPAETLSTLRNTSVNITGNLTLKADSTALINSTVTNAAVSEASALFGASGTSASAILSSNMVNSKAEATINFTTSGIVSVGGVLDMDATDNATIHADTIIVSSSTTTNDFGAGIARDVISGQIDVEFLSEDGSKEIEFGEKVRKGDQIFEYLGNKETVNLTTVDYADLDYWKEVSGTQIIPKGMNFDDSDSMAIGGLVVRNDVRSDVKTSINRGTITTGSASLNATLKATIKAKADSTVTSSGGSAFGSGDSLAINATIATNLVLSDAVATITNSDVTTTSGNLTVDGVNSSTIDATTKNMTSSGDTAVGVTLAFNTIGWEAQNILFAAIDALIGTDIGNEDPALVNASIVNSDLHLAGSLNLSADSKATLNVLVCNDATSAASALVDASGKAIGVVLASNMVSSAAQAFIDHTGSQGIVDVTGDITITAKDDASISADSTMKAISSTTNDGGASVLGGLVDAVSDEYAFTSNSGSRFIKNGECVRVASTHGSGGVVGSIYKYLDVDGTSNLGSANYSDTSTWKRQSKENVLDAFSGINVSDSDSVGAGGIVVRNDVRSDVQSYIDNAMVTSGNLFLCADESATILALLTGIAESSGGSSFGEGESLAVNAQIATNLVLSKANAYIKDSTVTAANVGVDSKNTSIIDATINASTKSGDTAVGVTLAFNTVGWKAQNILFAAIDALIGTNIGAPQPAETLSTLQDTAINITGNLTLKADSTALINSTVTNAAVSEASALFGASGTSASAILSSNMVNNKAEATINFTTSGIVSVGGVLDMDAADNATIHADTIIVSSSTTTNDFGAGIARDVISGQIDVEFLSEDGSKEIEFGEKVRKGDQIFEYLGNKETVNLTTVDYADLDYWKEVTGTQIIPKGMNFDDSDSMAIGGLVVRNDVRSDVKTSINRGTITAGSASLNATLKATIKAKADSTVTSSGGSAFGSGDSLAVNATIATNLVLSDAVATITNSDVTTTSGNLTIDGVNSSTIDATTKNMTSSGDTAVGVTLAFNTIGWEAQNILFAAIDALIGTDIGNEDPALVTASIVNSDLHLAGSLNLSADSKATLNVLVCNDATSAASALVDASGKAIGVVLASNMVSSAAQAFIDHTGSQGIVDVSGSITITAKDDASISADSTMKAISSTTNDGGASVLGGLVDAVSDEYAFTSNSGSRFIKNGECVRVASTHGSGGVVGSIYKYLDVDGTSNLGSANYSDTSTWKRQSKENVLDAFSGINVSDSDSVGAGGIVVRNDVRSDVQSYIDNAMVTSGNLFLCADESATILALLTGIAESSGGSSFGEGESLAVNAQIATNLVLSKANAYIKDSTVTAANVGVDSKNTSIIDATIDASTKSGDTAVGVTLAFNTVGWEAQNILFAAIDALIGTNIGDPQPAETLSTLQDTAINITGNLTLKADSTALINSTVTNAAVSEASALFGASGTSAAAILSSNMVNSKAEATIHFTTSGIVSVGGVLDMDATDNATIHADTIIVSSSTTTSDFGAGIARDVISGQIDVEFLSEDGSQEIEFGEKVRKGDHIFEYLGNKETVNLTTVDYADLDYWREISGTQIIPEGMNFDDSDSMAIGGLVVRNDVRSDVKTSINRGTVTAGSASLNATLNATIKAKADSTVTSSGGSAFGSGDSLAVNATIATNLVLSDAVATITNSDVTTTSGNLTIDGVNSSTIDATTKNMTSSGDTAVGVTLAFNTIGWEAQNILFAAIDALIGTDIGNEDPALVTASIVNSDLHLAGSLNLSADSKATLNVLVCNDATSAASALVDASGKAIGVVLASNMVSSAVQAFIDHTGSQGIVDVTGDITITAKDDASISADSTMKAISSTTNDGGLSVLGGLIDATTEEYAFTSKSGNRFIEKEKCVRVASGHVAGGVAGGIYKYLGENATLNLGTVDYSNTSNWDRQTNGKVTDALSGINVSDSDSMGAGGIVVRNDVRSGVESYINNAAVTSGDLLLSADESAMILALLNGIVSSSGGSSFGDGESLAINGQIATNLVLSKARAYISGGSVIATNVTVNGKNTSGIDATIKAITTSGDTAVGVTLAFNTIGWEAQNILFAAIDALIGTNIGDPQAAETSAYIKNTPLTLTGNLSLSADSTAIINATVSNAAESAASAMFGASGAAASAVLSSNMVNSSTAAYIDFTGGVGVIGVGGNLNINAVDSTGIYANSKVVSSSVTTNDGGVSLLTGYTDSQEEVDYLSGDGSQMVDFGSRVRLSKDYENGGDGGSIYKYMGPGKPIDLSKEDYTDVGYWLQDSETDFFPDKFNVSDSDSMAIGGLVVRNDIRCEVDAHIKNAAITSGSLTVTALEDAIIKATADCTAESSGGSAFGDGDSLAVNGTIATNLVLSKANAFVTGGYIITTVGDVIIDSKNTSIIDAKTLNSTTSSNDSVTVTLAFNTIGWEAQNVLFAAIDALIGTDIGNEDPSVVKAYLNNTPVNAAGAISVTAISKARIDATVSNQSAAGAAVGVVVSSNMVSSGAYAYIDSETPSQSIVANGGGIDILSKDDSSINANCKLSAISDGSDGWVNMVVDGVSDMLDVTYTDRSGVVNLKKEDVVLLDDIDFTTDEEPDELLSGQRVSLMFSMGGGADGDVFEYVGAETLIGPVDLDGQDFTDGSKWKKMTGVLGGVYQFIGDDQAGVNLANENFSDTLRWAVVSSVNPIDDVPGVNTNIDDSDSSAFGGLVVRNDVRSDVVAYMNNSDIRAAGDVTVITIESATIASQDKSTVTSSGGSMFGGGSSTAVNATIATNAVQSKANGYISNGSVTTTHGGDVIIDTENVSTIDAIVESKVESNGTSVGVVLAFNTIGWDAQNILFAAVDALFGTTIGTEDPSQVKAYTKNADIFQTGKFLLPRTWMPIFLPIF